MRVRLLGVVFAIADGFGYVDCDCNRRNGQRTERENTSSYDEGDGGRNHGYRAYEKCYPSSAPAVHDSRIHYAVKSLGLVYHAGVVPFDHRTLDVLMVRGKYLGMRELSGPLSIEELYLFFALRLIEAAAALWAIMSKRIRSFDSLYKRSSVSLLSVPGTVKSLIIDAISHVLLLPCVPYPLPRFYDTLSREQKFGKE